MYLTLKKSLIAASLAFVAAGLCSAPAAMAAEKKVAEKKAAAKKAPAKKKAEPKVEEDTGPSEADEGDTITTDYRCELGNTLTIFQHADDDSHIALRWKKRIHRLDKVGTTTGAQRYQNPVFGLIWIGIPSKGMLLDAKLNRQLANECKNADQEKGDFAAKPVVRQAEQPSTKVIEKVEPIVPPVPATPLTPGAPVTTVTPVTPVTPVTSATPITPAATVAPVTPVTPVAPATPVAPVTPVPQVSPETPATPVTPVTPVLPETPATPAAAGGAPAAIAPSN